MKKHVIAAALFFIPASVAFAQGTAATKPKADKNTMRLYKGQNFSGESYVVDSSRSSLMLEMNVGSIAVYPGEKWEVCEKPRFKGACNIVEADLNNMGAVAIQSARPVKPPKQN